MHILAGTGRLVRLALRRDRVKLPIWIAGIVGLNTAVASAAIDVYGTAEERIEYAVTTASSTLARIFNGPLDGPSQGSVVMGEAFLTIALFVAFMSAMSVIRHTRHNEETGSAELIGSAVVGRHANLVAALLVSMLANLAVAAGVFVSLYALHDLPLGGSLGFAGAIMAAGLAFAGVAAVTAQLSDSARGASALAGGVIGASFVIRVIGDSMGSLSWDGLSITTAWPSWLSPLGWAYQVYPFTKQQWWVFGIFAAFVILAIGIAFVLSARRDVGMSIFPARRGPVHAAKSLLSTLGLAWRLQKGTLLGWAITFALLGIVFGRMADEFANILNSNESFRQYLSSLGGSGQLADVLFTVVFKLAGIIACAYVVSSLLKARSEEATGNLESVLGAATSRLRWLASHSFWALVGATALMSLVGISTGINYVLISDAAWSEVGRLTGAALAQLPAILIFAGVAIALIGVLPRAMAAVLWAGFAYVLIINQVGPLLKLPQWSMNLSPFTHVPAVPSQSLDSEPLLILGGVVVALIVTGFTAFRRRDLTVS